MAANFQDRLLSLHEQFTSFCQKAITRPELTAWVLAAVLPILGAIIFPAVFLIPWTVFVGWIVYSQFYDVKMIDGRGKAVYITGCDSGFGLAIAKDLYRKGCTVFAGCLSTDSEGASFLKTISNDRMIVLDLDVTSKDKIDNCANAIEQWVKEDKGDGDKQQKVKGLWALINNAGIAMAGEVEFMQMEHYRRSIEVNCLGPIAVSKSVLPLIRKAKGRVITITSGIARSPEPGRSPYCVSKAALESFVDVLRYEMKKFGVKVITVCPGNFTGVTNVFNGLASHYDTKVVPNIPQRIQHDYGRSYLDAFRAKILTGTVFLSV